MLPLIIPRAACCLLLPSCGHDNERIISTNFQHITKSTAHGSTSTVRLRLAATLLCPPAAKRLPSRAGKHPQGKYPPGSIHRTSIHADGSAHYLQALPRPPPKKTSCRLSAGGLFLGGSIQAGSCPRQQHCCTTMSDSSATRRAETNDMNKMHAIVSLDAKA